MHTENKNTKILVDVRQSNDNDLFQSIECSDKKKENEEHASDNSEVHKQVSDENNEKELLQDLWDFFKTTDKNQDRYINFAELKVILKKLNQFDSDKEVIQMMQLLSGGNSSVIDFPRFADSFYKLYHEHLSKQSDEDMDREVFGIFDVNKDGHIAIEEIKEIIHEYCVSTMVEDFTEDRIVE
ncbi:hypothetical protein ABK040_012966 [Willaertia magna]